MHFEKVEVQNLAVIQESEIDSINVKQEIINAPFGVVYILNEKKQLRAWGGLDFYASNKFWGGYFRYDWIPFIKTGENVMERAGELSMKNPFLSCIPVINEQDEMVYALKCFPDKWYLEEYSYLKQLDASCFNDNLGVIKSFLYINNISSIAVYGISSFSIRIAEMIKDLADITMIESGLTRDSCKENIINSELEFRWIDTLEQYLEEAHPDCIFIMDWRYRNLVNCDIKGIPVVWIGNLLKEAEKYQFEFLRMQECNKLNEIGVNLLTVAVPNEKELGIKIKDRGTALEWYTWFARELDGTLDDGKEFMRMRMEAAKNVKKMPDSRCLADYKSKYLNIQAGCRVIPLCNHEAGKTIYLIGACIVTGQFNKDENTLGNFLQKELNKRKLSYKVVCLALPNEVDRRWYFSALEQYRMKDGDVVLWIETSAKFIHQDIYLDKEYDDLLKKYGNEFYFDFLMHVGKAGTQKIAVRLADEITKKREIRKTGISCFPVAEGKKENNVPSELKQYLEDIKRKSFIGKLIIGAIVMNCNPFTLGHRYLIEYASKQVDYLYVFVVEENKSFFSTQERMEMVQMGTEDLENVMVFLSGNFMISANTFSEYFRKDTVIGKIDASADVELFGRYIAPALGIRIRFVGKEPLDVVTNQYNESLKSILPGYGVEVCEIDRLEKTGQVISASRVRKYMEKGRWNEIKEIVPKTTYDYILKKYGDIRNGYTC